MLIIIDYYSRYLFLFGPSVCILKTTGRQKIRSLDAVPSPGTVQPLRQSDSHRLGARARAGRLWSLPPPSAPAVA